MVMPNQAPNSLSRRLRRLEMLFFASLITSDEEGDDEDLWLELRHLFRRQRDSGQFDSCELYFLDRLMERRRRNQPESQVRQANQIREEVQSLQARLNSLQIESHSFLAIQTLGLDSNEVRLERYIPVRIYIDETPGDVIDHVSDAIGEAMLEFYFVLADEFPEITGSWFKKWFAKTKEVLSQPKLLSVSKVSNVPCNFRQLTSLRPRLMSGRRMRWQS